MESLNINGIRSAWEFIKSRDFQDSVFIQNGEYILIIRPGDFRLVRRGKHFERPLMRELEIRQEILWFGNSFSRIIVKDPLDISGIFLPPHPSRIHLIAPPGLIIYKIAEFSPFSQKHLHIRSDGMCMNYHTRRVGHPQCNITLDDWHCSGIWTYSFDVCQDDALIHGENKMVLPICYKCSLPLKDDNIYTSVTGTNEDIYLLDRFIII